MNRTEELQALAAEMIADGIDNQEAYKQSNEQILELLEYAQNWDMRHTTQQMRDMRHRATVATLHVMNRELNNTLAAYGLETMSVEDYAIANLETMCQNWLMQRYINHCNNDDDDGEERRAAYEEIQALKNMWDGCYRNTPWRQERCSPTQ
jgi:hypothetical protein